MQLQGKFFNVVESWRLNDHRPSTLPSFFPSAIRLSATFVSLALLSFPSFSAWAQSTGIAPAQRAEEGLRRQEERLREQLQQQQPKRDVLRPEPATSLVKELPDETPCFMIEEFRFEGEGAKRFDCLKNVAAPYRGRCIGLEGGRRVASLLDAKLIEWGYVTTKVSLPVLGFGDN